MFPRIRYFTSSFETDLDLFLTAVMSVFLDYTKSSQVRIIKINFFVYCYHIFRIFNSNSHKRAKASPLTRASEEEMGQNIQEWTKQNLWKTAFKKFEGIWSA